MSEQSTELAPSLSTLVSDLLRGTERRTLPTLTREELLATGVAPRHPEDVAWLEGLSEREVALVGEAGTRSLIARGLVAGLGDPEPSDEVLVVLAATQAPTWLLLLDEPATGTQLLYRGVPETPACLVSGATAGIHAHALCTRAAGLREAARWLERVPAGGTRVAARVRSGAGEELRVRRSADCLERVELDGTTVELAGGELLSWLEAVLPDAD